MGVLRAELEEGILYILHGTHRKHWLHLKLSPKAYLMSSFTSLEMVVAHWLA